VIFRRLLAFRQLRPPISDDLLVCHLTPTNCTVRL
jgi:hypothetical protein